MPIGALGSGSDYTAFLDHLTIASLNMGFGGEGSDGGVYHSTYDSFYWYTHFSDTDFAYGAALSRTIGTAILRLAERRHPAVRVHGHGDDAARLRDELDKLRKDIKDAPPLEITLVLAAVERLAKAADTYDRALGSACDARRGAGSREAGRAEPAALHLGARLQARGGPAEARVVQAPRLRARGSIPATASRRCPASAKASNRRAWDEPRKFIPIVVTAINKLAAQVDQASLLLAPPR